MMKLANKGISIDKYIDYLLKGKKVSGLGQISNKVIAILNASKQHKEVLNEKLSEEHTADDLKNLYETIRKFINKNNINASIMETAEKIAETIYQRNVTDLQSKQIDKLIKLIKSAEYNNGNIEFKNVDTSGNVFADDSTPIAEKTEYASNSTAIANLEQYYEKLSEKIRKKRKNKRYKVNFFKKAYYTLNEVLGDIAVHIGDMKLIDVGYRYTTNLRRYLDIADRIERGFSQLHLSEYRNLKPEQHLAIINWLENPNDETLRVLRNMKLEQFAQDLKGILEKTKGIVAKRRIKKFFEGRLKLSDFTKEQQKYLLEWEKQYHFSNPAMRDSQMWTNFLNNIENFRLNGADTFIVKNYFPHKRERQLLQKMLGSFPTGIFLQKKVWSSNSTSSVMISPASYKFT
jgi:hypothetical protein